jgi:septal ring factor EnvC (AmiA/AmiB activator)
MGCKTETTRTTAKTAKSKLDTLINLKEKPQHEKLLKEKLDRIKNTLKIARWVLQQNKKKTLTSQAPESERCKKLQGILIALDKAKTHLKIVDIYVSQKTCTEKIMRLFMRLVPPVKKGLKSSGDYHKRKLYKVLMKIRSVIQYSFWLEYASRDRLEYTSRGRKKNKGTRNSVNSRIKLSSIQQQRIERLKKRHTAMLKLMKKLENKHVFNKYYRRKAIRKYRKKHCSTLKEVLKSLKGVAKDLEILPIYKSTEKCPIRLLRLYIKLSSIAIKTSDVESNNIDMILHTIYWSLLGYIIAR